jgi:hypothetical protein
MSRDPQQFHTEPFQLHSSTTQSAAHIATAVGQSTSAAALSKPRKQTDRQGTGRWVIIVIINDLSQRERGREQRRRRGKWGGEGYLLWFESRSDLKSFLLVLCQDFW